MSKLGWAVAGFLLLTSGCVSSEVTVTGAKHASRVAGCAITVFPSTTPDYKWEDIASVKARCHNLVGRTACIDELKNRACDLGGDTLYGLKDGEDQNSSVVIGTVAIRSDGSAAKAAPAGEIAKTGGEPPKPSAEPAPTPATAAPAAATPAPGGASCDPPCSPGYKCGGGQCLAVCNPPCEAGMRCNQKRICEAAQ